MAPTTSCCAASAALTASEGQGCHMLPHVATCLWFCGALELPEPRPELPTDDSLAGGPFEVEVWETLPVHEHADDAHVIQ